MLNKLGLQWPTCEAEQRLLIKTIQIPFRSKQRDGSAIVNARKIAAELRHAKTDTLANCHWLPVTRSRSGSRRWTNSRHSTVCPATIATLCPYPVWGWVQDLTSLTHGTEFVKVRYALQVYLMTNSGPGFCVTDICLARHPSFSPLTLAYNQAG